jgi:hypothetical protein
VISAVKKIASLMVARYWVGRHPEKGKKEEKEVKDLSGVQRQDWKLL